MALDRLRRLSSSLEQSGISAEEFFAQSDEAIDDWLEHQGLGMTLREILKEAVELSDEDLDAVSGGLAFQADVARYLALRKQRTG